MTATIYHNPACGTSRNTLALIRHAGIEPTIVEYLKHPPSRPLLIQLIEDAGLTPRTALREKEKLCAELGLVSTHAGDDALLDAMIEHPILINCPFVVTPMGTRLCRPSEIVLDVLPGFDQPFLKEDGEVVAPRADSRRPLAPLSVGGCSHCQFVAWRRASGFARFGVAALIIALAMAMFVGASTSMSSSAALLPACSAAQLSITFDGENGNFSGMSHAGTLLVVRNIGTGACRTAALPEVSFENAAHRPLSIVREVPKGMHPGPVVLPVGIAPGAEATAELRWISGDVYDGHHCVSPAVAVVQVGIDAYRQSFAGHFCSAVNTPATFTQTWLKTDAHL